MESNQRPVPTSGIYQSALASFVLRVFGTRRTEALLFVVSFMLRAAILVFLMLHFGSSSQPANEPLSVFPVIGGDSLEYATAARNLVLHGEFSLSSELPLYPDSFRTPGYPMFVALFIKLGFGFVGAVIFQVLLSSLTVVLVYRIARRFLGDTTSIAAAVLFMVEPSAIFYSAVVLSDTLFVFLEFLSLYLLLKAVESTERRAYVLILLSGLVLGYSVLVRPIAQFLPVVLVSILIALVWKRWSWRMMRTALIAFILGVVVVVIPWSMRNHRIFGSYELSSVTAVTFHSYYAPMFHAYKYGGTHAEATQMFYEQVPGDRASLEYKSLRNAPKLMEAGLEYISSDWRGYIRFHLLKSSLFFLTDGVRDILRMIGILPAPAVSYSDLLLAGRIGDFGNVLSLLDIHVVILAVSVGFWAVVSSFALYAAIAAARKRDALRSGFIAACIALSVYFALLTGPVSNPRYRLPAEPFMFMAAAAGASALVRRLPPGLIR